MKKNMSLPDKIIRTLIAVVIVFLFYDGTVSGTIGILLLSLAGIFILTSFISFCPLYSFLGISTVIAKNKDFW